MKSIDISDETLLNGIIYEQMFATGETGGNTIRDAIEKRQNTLKSIPEEELFTLLYLGTAYEEAQKLQKQYQPIYNGWGYSSDAIAPLYQQFPDYEDSLWDVAIKGFSIGFIYGLNVAVIQASAESVYYQRFLCPANVAGDVQAAVGGTVNPAKTGNGYVLKTTVQGRTFTIRIMNAGSGNRTAPYYRVSVEGKGALTINGTLSSNQALTHIDLSMNTVSEIQKIIQKYLGSIQ